ncbi:MAG: hypothetical protein JSR99_00820 [Proteobacteria bacterium]|nr:hypothetical protein [Pseudomonadota bacterium]
MQRRAARLADMIERLDVDKGTLFCRGMGAAYADARAKCFRCENKRSCSAWLVSPEIAHAAPAFCPNAALLEDCRRPFRADTDL